VTDHLEELQRKCVKHVRKPLSKAMLEDLKAAEKEKHEEMEDVEGGGEKEKEKEKKESTGKDSRDWRRNGMCTFMTAVDRCIDETLSDDRWLEWLDSKLALLINRDGVDPRLYFGKNYDE